MKQKDELDPQLRKMLEALKNVPERDPARAEAGRAQFLKLAEQMKPRTAPTAQPKRSWWQKFANAFGARSAGMRLAQGVVAVLLLAVVVLGGGVMVARAAYNSLPGEPLYPVKQALENGEILLAFSPERKAELHLEIAQERLAELQSVARRGNKALAAKVAADLEAHVREADSISSKITLRSNERAEHLRALAQKTKGMTESAMAYAPPNAKKHLRRAYRLAAKIAGAASQHHQTTKPTPTPSPALPAPAAGATEIPSPIRTSAPRPTQTLYPSRTPHPRRTPHATRTPQPRHTPPHPVVTPTFWATPTIFPTWPSVGGQTPIPTPHPTHNHIPRRTPHPTPTQSH